MAIIERDEDGVVTALNFFGYNMAKVTCFKTSSLVGFGAMVPACVGYLYWTGKTGNLLNVAFISYWGAFWPFWFSCRYYKSKTKFEVEKAMTIAQQVALTRGTTNDMRQGMPEEMRSFIIEDAPKIR